MLDGYTQQIRLLYACCVYLANVCQKAEEKEQRVEKENNSVRWKTERGKRISAKITKFENGERPARQRNPMNYNHCWIALYTYYLQRHSHSCWPGMHAHKFVRYFAIGLSPSCMHQAYEHARLPDPNPSMARMHCLIADWLLHGWSCVQRK